MSGQWNSWGYPWLTTQLLSLAVAFLQYSATITHLHDTLQLKSTVVGALQQFWNKQKPGPEVQRADLIKSHTESVEPRDWERKQSPPLEWGSPRKQGSAFLRLGLCEELMRASDTDKKQKHTRAQVHTHKRAHSAA